MRSFLIAIAFIIISGCKSGPYYNLRKPIYLVTEQSFWFGCEEDPRGYEGCQKYRLQQVGSGIEQWFGPLYNTLHPIYFIVDSRSKAPHNLVNETIYLKIEKGNCGKDAYGKREAGACYGRDHWYSRRLYIVFENPNQITARVMAHEFGHTLGRDDNDVPKGTGSVMSYDTPTDVLLMDIEKMCKLHYECRKVKWKNY